MKFQAKLYPNKLEADWEKIKKFMTDFPSGIRAEIVPLLPESRNMRKYLHGAVYPLLAYLDGKNYKDNAILEDIHEVCKAEFNGKMISFNGKAILIGQSTRGRQILADYVERVISFLEEQYGIDRAKVLDPEHYKDYRDRVFPDPSSPPTYIDYLQMIGKLK